MKAIRDQFNDYRHSTICLKGTPWIKIEQIPKVRFPKKRITKKILVLNKQVVRYHHRVIHYLKKSGSLNNIIRQGFENLKVGIVTASNTIEIKYDLTQVL